MGQYGPFDNECSACRYETERPGIERENRRRERIRWIESGGARDALLRQNRPTVPVYESKYDKRLLRSAPRVSYVEQGRAWVVGTFRWAHDDLHEYGPSITMIAASRGLRPVRYGLTLGMEWAGAPGILAGGGHAHSDVENENALLDAVVRMVGVSDVPPALR